MMKDSFSDQSIGGRYAERNKITWIESTRDWTGKYFIGNIITA